VNDILDKIRINSIVLSNEHKRKYFCLAKKIKWFRIPVIVLSALGSLFGFGLSPFLQQSVISEICSVLSLIVGLIGSLELFLGLNTKMENELLHSKELYLFAIEIQKTLLLDVEHRHCDGMIYLEDRFMMYSKFIQDSYLLECRIIDTLTPLPKKYQKKIEVDIDKSVKLSENTGTILVQPKRNSLIKLLTGTKIVKRNKVEPVSVVPITDIKKNLSSPKDSSKRHTAPFTSGVKSDGQLSKPSENNLTQCMENAVRAVELMENGHAHESKKPPNLSHGSSTSPLRATQPSFGDVAVGGVGRD